MRRISFALSVLAGLVVSGSASAQCMSGTGGAASGGTSSTSTGGGTTVASAGTTAGTLLTGPGSWFNDVMVAQAMQRQIAQRQYVLAMQQQAAKQQQLAARRYRAEQQRAQVAAARQRNRERLLAVSGSSATESYSRYLAANVTR